MSLVLYRPYSDRTLNTFDHHHHRRRSRRSRHRRRHHHHNSKWKTRVRIS